MNSQKKTADKYQKFFNLMANKYDLILIESEMDEIIEVAKKVVELSDTPAEIEKEEIVKRYETFAKADTTPIFLKENVFKCMDEYARWYSRKTF